MANVNFDGNEFLKKLASVLWEDFNLDNRDKLNYKEKESVREMVRQLIANPVLVFRQDRWKNAWNLLASEGIVKELYSKDAEYKLKSILNK